MRQRALFHCPSSYCLFRQRCLCRRSLSISPISRCPAPPERKSGSYRFRHRLFRADPARYAPDYRRYPHGQIVVALARSLSERCAFPSSDQPLYNRVSRMTRLSEIPQLLMFSQNLLATFFSRTLVDFVVDSHDNLRLMAKVPRVVNPKRKEFTEAAGSGRPPLSQIRHILFNVPAKALVQQCLSDVAAEVIPKSVGFLQTLFLALTSGHDT